MRSNTAGLPHFIVGLVVIIGCLLSPCQATVDLSNVDLQNFRYFKYPQQSQRQLTPPIAGPPLPIPVRLRRLPNGQPAQQLIVVRTIVRPLQERQSPAGGGAEAGPLAKVSAVFGYVGRVLFGNLPNEPEVPVKFHPDAAYRMREQYQRQFGYRGERLIEQLGRGREG